MSRKNIREASVVIAEKIRNGEVASIDQAVLDAAGGAEEFVYQAAVAQLRKDTASVERNARAASLHGQSMQLEIPGVEHAAFPFWVKVIDKETGERLGVPPTVATLDEIDAEVARLEQKAEMQKRVADGYRATIQRLRDLGVPGDMTGADIAAHFGSEVEASAARLEIEG